MFVSDRHPDRERLLNGQSADPPVPAGETLFDFERNQGNARVRVQTWERGTGGRWWPRRGAAVTFRLRELPELVEVLSAIGPDARPARESSPWADDPPQPARQDRSGANRGTCPDVREDGPPRRAVASPTRSQAAPRERSAGRPQPPADPRRRWDPSTLPDPSSTIGSADFDETGP